MSMREQIGHWAVDTVKPGQLLDALDRLDRFVNHTPEELDSNELLGHLKGVVGALAVVVTSTGKFVPGKKVWRGVTDPPPHLYRISRGLHTESGELVHGVRARPTPSGDALIERLVNVGKVDRAATIPSDAHLSTYHPTERRYALSSVKAAVDEGGVTFYEPFGARSDPHDASIYRQVVGSLIADVIENLKPAVIPDALYRSMSTDNLGDGGTAAGDRDT